MFDICCQLMKCFVLLRLMVTVQRFSVRVRWYWFGLALFYYRTFLLLFSFEDGRPCLVIVFRMPWFQKPSLTKCLPMDSRLVKDHLKSRIGEDVDHVEEISGAGLALNVVELLVLLFIVFAACAKSYSAVQRSRTTHPSLPAVSVSNPASLFGAHRPAAGVTAASSTNGVASPSSASLTSPNAVVAPMPNNGAASPPSFRSSSMVGPAPNASMNRGWDICCIVIYMYVQIVVNCCCHSMLMNVIVKVLMLWFWLVMVVDTFSCLLFLTIHVQYPSLLLLYFLG